MQHNGMPSIKKIKQSKNWP